MKNLPNDLLTVSIAAVEVNKSPSTIRYYVSKGKISKYSREPNKQNSPLLVSRSELLAYCSLNVSPKKTTAGRQESKTASVVKLHKDNDAYKQQYESARREIEVLSKLLASQNLHLEDLRKMKSNEVLLLTNQLKDLKVEIEREREKNARLENNVERLRWYLSLPWYRRFAIDTPLLKG